ncbi:hypothetical protein [Streptomyces chartreusis]|uniref:hypothetical protein n=1 Tax=Streptomyces chartreusis TaxID=1969 RepID=UPI0033C7EBF1
MIYVILVTGLAAAAGARAFREHRSFRTEQRVAAAWATASLLISMIMWDQW